MDNTDFDISSIIMPSSALSSDDDVKTMEQQEIERFGKDTKLRGTLAIWTMVIISVWLGFVLAIVIFCKHLSTEVAITLLATTTINILGLPKIILEGLFTRGRKRYTSKNNR